MNNMSFAKIDTHAHFVPDFYAEALREAGHLPGPDGINSIPSWSPEEHLKFMKENNIRKSYLSISTPGVFLNPPSPTNTSIAIALARRVNKYASDLKSKYPDQFGFFASLPLPDIPSTLAEIEYCYTALDPPPDGFCVLSNAFGMYLGDPAMSPVYDALNARNAIIFEHPTTPCSTANSHYAGSSSTAPPPSQHGDHQPHNDGSSNTYAEPRARQFLNRPLAQVHMAPMLDFLFDTTRTITDLLLTGTPTRFPNLTWLIPHAGGALPATLDRVIAFAAIMGQKSSVDLVNPTATNSSSSSYSASAATAPATTPTPDRRPPMAALTAAHVRHLFRTSFYFDLAGPDPFHAQLPALLRWTDPERLLYGSDVPFTPWRAAGALAAAFEDGVVGFWGAETGAAECAGVLAGNARRLFEGSRVRL